MVEQLKILDRELLIYLNGLGSKPYDGFWLFITNQLHWTPFFLFLIYLVYKKLGAKQTGYIVLLVAVLILMTDQTCNLFKNHFQRLRPCNTPDLQGIIRIVKTSSSYSFFSGHAANTTAVAVFLIALLKKHIKYSYILLIWPLVFSYSRIYLGLHYPIDLLTGYFFGSVFGIATYQFYNFLIKKHHLV